MEIILLERVENLGQMGDVVTVKDGYARNFLLPRKKALRATENNKKMFEAQKAQLEAENLKRKEEAQNVAEKMVDTEVVLIRQAGEMGQLYGSVNARDVATALIEAGVKVDRKQVALTAPIKSLGLFDVKVVLHPEVSVDITANVARTEEEAKQQKQIGGALVRNLDEDEDDTVAATAPTVETVEEVKEEPVAEVEDTQAADAEAKEDKE